MLEIRTEDFVLQCLPSPLRDIIDSHLAIECFSLYSDFNIGALFEVKFVNSCTIYIIPFVLQPIISRRSRDR